MQPYLTEESLKALRTLTSVSIHSIDTDCTKFTQIRHAVINVILTVGTGEPTGAVTLIPANHVHTQGAVHARVTGAFEEFRVAVGARVPRCTRAGVGVYSICTSCSVNARIAEAFINIGEALRTCEKYKENSDSKKADNKPQDTEQKEGDLLHRAG